jgi:hypothetical protein
MDGVRTAMEMKYRASVLRLMAQELFLSLLFPAIKLNVID